MTQEKSITEIRNLIRVHREAGKVKRFHTASTIKTQTISDHVYNMMRIFQAIWGYPTDEDWLALIYHDVEELEMGDWPHWACLRPGVPEIKASLEEAFWKNFGKKQPHSTMRITICDWIECVEFMLDEFFLGNEILREGAVKLFDKIESMLKDVSEWDQRRINGYLDESGLRFRIEGE